METEWLDAFWVDGKDEQSMKEEERKTNTVTPAIADRSEGLLFSLFFNQFSFFHFLYDWDILRIVCGICALTLKTFFP